jgi:hypothetical protein
MPFFPSAAAHPAVAQVRPSVERMAASAAVGAAGAAR